MEWLYKELNLSPDTQFKIFETCVIVCLIWLTRFVTVKVLYRKIEDVRVLYRWQKIISHTSVILTLFFVGSIWLSGIRSLATFLGLLSAGLAIALKDPITNLAGWGFIIWRRPFELGDRIQIGQFAGDVVAIRIFQFTILEIGNWVDADQSTGRIIHVPNSKVFYESLANYTMEFNYIWNEIPVLITFESNWIKAKNILLEIVNRHAENISEDVKNKVHQAARRFLIIYTKFTPIVYTSVKEYGVKLTIRYMCEPRRRRSSEEAIWENILAAFARETDIEFAYPTQRFYSRHFEGHNTQDELHIHNSFLKNKEK